MTDPINLNHVRKARAKAEARRRADENAATHGLTRAEKDRAKAQADRLRAALESHKKEP